MPPRIRKCILCGKEFEAPNGFVKRCPDQHYATCQVCGKQFPIDCEPNQIPKTCSEECRRVAIVRKRDKTVKEKYGVDNVSELDSVKSKISERKIQPKIELAKPSSRNCAWCGTPFQSSNSNQKYCKGPHFMICPVCGEMYQVKENTELSKHPHACSRKCAAVLRKQNNGGISPGHTVEAINKRNTSRLSKRTCDLCGKVFEGVETSRYCDGPHYTDCEICGKVVEIPRGYEYKKDWTCSEECARLKRERTCMDKYGVRAAAQSDSVKQKLSETAKSDEYKENRINTCLDRYGYEYVSQVPEVRNKISETMKSKECQTQLRNTTFSRFGTLFAMQNDEIKEKQSRTIQEKYGVPWACLTDKCKNAQGHVISKLNERFGEMLDAQNVTHEFELRLENRAFDILLTDTETLIEIDPTYTHNVVGNHWGEGLEPDYHLKKSELAEEYGYRCIHIFDWDDWDKVIAMLTPRKRRLFARNLNIGSLDKKEADLFIDKYHLQGKCRGNVVNLGLFDGDDLIQVMTFGKPRYNKKYENELLRLCTRSDCYVVGGAERLFTYFIRNFNPESIISYCDRSKFSGAVYERLGMELVSVAEPAKVWSCGSDKITDNLLRQRGFDQLFNANFGKGTSNEELMLQHGWLPVYDCGQHVYGWHR